MNRKNIYIAIAVAIVGCVIVVLLFKYLSPSDEKKKEEKTTTVVSAGVIIKENLPKDKADIKITLVVDANKNTIKEYIDKEKSIYIGSDIVVNTIAGHSLKDEYYDEKIDDKHRCFYRVISSSDTKMTIDFIIYENTFENTFYNLSEKKTVFKPTVDSMTYTYCKLKYYNDDEYEFKIMKPTEMTGLNEEKMKRLVDDKKIYLILFKPSVDVAKIIDNQTFSLKSIKEHESYIIQQK